MSEDAIDSENTGKPAPDSPRDSRIAAVEQTRGKQAPSPSPKAQELADT